MTIPNCETCVFLHRIDQRHGQCRFEQHQLIGWKESSAGSQNAQWGWPIVSLGGCHWCGRYVESGKHNWGNDIRTV